MKKSRKLAWVVLGVILFALPVVALPLWEWLVWVEVQGGVVFLLREYENRLTGARIVRVVDSDGSVALSFNPDDLLSYNIATVGSGRQSTSL